MIRPARSSPGCSSKPMTFPPARGDKRRRWVQVVNTVAPGPLCALPSTVQSAIALTSIAQGNVAGTVCAATASSLIGLLLTPLPFGFTSHLYGGAIDVFGMWKIL